jgi:hypothetical protein
MNPYRRMGFALAAGMFALACQGQGVNSTIVITEQSLTVGEIEVPAADRKRSVPPTQTTPAPTSAPVAKPASEHRPGDRVGVEHRRREPTTTVRGTDSRTCPTGTCNDDGDCESTEACFCRAGGGPSRCVPASCRKDADCPSGRCLEVVLKGARNRCSENAIAFRCSSRDDECEPGRACGPGSEQTCMFSDSAGRFQCAEFCLR